MTHYMVRLFYIFFDLDSENKSLERFGQTAALVLGLKDTVKRTCGADMSERSAVEIHGLPFPHAMHTSAHGTFFGP